MLTFEQINALNPHPLCQLLNTEEFKLDDWQRERLRVSISVHGVLKRIVIDQSSGLVLDGWNTLQQWKSLYSYGKTEAEMTRVLANINAQIEFKEFATDVERKRFVADMQFAGRNLGARERAVLGKRILNYGKAAAAAPTVEQIAEFSGVSTRTVEAVNRMDRQAAPELESVVASGKLSYHDADTLLAAGVGRGEQAELAQDPAAAKVRAIALREEAKAKLDRAPGYGKRNVAAAMDRLHAEAAARRAAMPPPSPEGPGPGEREMAAPVDPRPKSAPAASAGASGGMSAADLNMAIRAYFKANPANEQRAAALMGIEGVAEAGWVADTPAGKRKFVVDRWQQLAGARREVTVRANGAPAFDKDKMWRTAESLQRSMSRNPQVGELCEALKQTLVYMP